MSVSKDQRALDMFMGAEPLQRIRDELGFKTVTSAEAAIRRALAEKRKGKDYDTERQLELERIDAMFRIEYPLAKQGDSAAMSTCLSLSEKRMRLLDKPGDHEGITASYEATLKALAITDADSALVATGRAVARQIDYALRHGQGQEVTKALYLVPHLMNVLRELGATPAARKQLKEYAGAAAAESDGEPVDELTAFRRRKFGI